MGRYSYSLLYSNFVFTIVVSLLLLTVCSTITIVHSQSIFTESFLFLDTDRRHGQTNNKTIRGEAIYTSDIELPNPVCSLVSIFVVIFYNINTIQNEFVRTIHSL